MLHIHIMGIYFSVAFSAVTLSQLVDFLWNIW